MRQINRMLLLLSSTRVVDAFNRIADTSWEKLLKLGMADPEIRAKQTDVARGIINALRCDLYPWQKPLPAESIRFIYPKRAVAAHAEE